VRFALLYLSKKNSKIRCYVKLQPQVIFFKKNNCSRFYPIILFEANIKNGASVFIKQIKDGCFENV
jgi:hypothetical protein